MRVLWGLRVSWLRDVRVRLTAVWGITRPLGSVDSIGCYGGGVALTQLAPLVGCWAIRLAQIECFCLISFSVESP